jgi:acetyl esterase/lipase
MRALACLLLLIQVGPSWADTLPVRSAGTPAVAVSGTQIIRDLEYTTGGGRSRSLDLYLPAPALEPLPLVVWIHGGSWRSGDKQRNKAAFLSAHGFATASINYRLLQEAPFPAQIQDCKAAIRFLRAHAAEFNLDPARIGVWGESAGGNLAALLGTTDGVAELAGVADGGLSQVQAVCDWFGPADMPTLLAQAQTVPPTSPLAKETKTILDLLGETPSAAVQRQASPLAFVSRDDAPFFILHGDQDPLVPLGQSEALCAALRAAGVEASLLVLPGAGHGGAAFETPAVQARIHEFFATHLSVQ